MSSKMLTRMRSMSIQCGTLRRFQTMTSSSVTNFMHRSMGRQNHDLADRRCFSIISNDKNNVSKLPQSNDEDDLLQIALKGGKPSFPKEVPGIAGIPSRAEQIRILSNENNTAKNEYDVLIVGGGATGAGCALDAATRGLNVACIERGDFASETSSRSTKLIWAGIRYMATAAASLLSKNLITNPVDTWSDFKSEIQMVMNCHKERNYMLSKQRHLCHWMPIAVPFSDWLYVSGPPPFGHALFSLFPALAPFVFKVYDALSGFKCPSSYVMSAKTARYLFPQLRDRDLKYVAVFYEAMHNDARTNLSIALSAAEHGANIANYVEMTKVLYNDTNKAVGVCAIDRMTGKEFTIHAKRIIFAGGPFTDELREKEFSDQMRGKRTDKTSKKFSPAVRGASGTHIVLPGYYCPNKMGLLDYNTSDGRFLFFLPWQNHTLVGTTDKKERAITNPAPPEDEVQWILNECGKYLSKDLQVRRSDVLSAWRGWRPLAADPHAPPGAPVSRDHVISENPDSGIIFIAGGKWTTWREMAEDVIDRITNKTCSTLDITLLGGGEFNANNLAIQLVQKHGMAHEVATHLVATYGARAWDVCQFSSPTNLTWPRFGKPLSPNYPHIDAEVRYACREYACTIEDILSRRTRLAFLNKDAAMSALPLVADIMAEELGWSDQVKAEQILVAEMYIDTYAGRIPKRAGSQLREVTFKDLHDIFSAIDTDNSGFLDRTEMGEVASILGFPMSDEELDTSFKQIDSSGDGRISFDEFETWWNGVDSDLKKRLVSELRLGSDNIDDLKQMGGGTMLG